MQVGSFLTDSAQRRPDSTSLVCRGRRLTYAEVDRASNRLAHALVEAGVRRGDRVAVCLDGSVEGVIAVFAILKAGAVFLMVNPTTKVKKLAYLLNDSQAVSLVLPARKLASHRPCWKQTPFLKTIISVGDQACCPDAAAKRQLNFTGLLEEYSDRDAPPDVRTIDIDLAAIIYTSGSTGYPKGVMLSHRNMVTAANSVIQYLENTSSDTILNVLPFSYSYGLYQVLMAFRFGGTVVLGHPFVYPHTVLQRLIEERATALPLVPTMVSVLLRMDLTNYDLSSLRYVTSAGAALPTCQIRRFRSMLPHVRIYSMYGLTECKRVSYLSPDDVDARPQSVGKAMPNLEAYPVDEEGRPVGPGVVGELVVRGANVMQGYWGLPQETARALKPGALPGDKVLYTGDLFRTDEEGYLYFVGRKDDMINNRGEKVSPREVEDAICSHPDVQDAAVVGVRDDALSDLIKAVVVVRQGRSMSANDVQRHCAVSLEDFMVPQLVEFRDELPRTGNGKIDRKALRGEQPAALTPV